MESNQRTRRGRRSQTDTAEQENVPSQEIPEEDYFHEGRSWYVIHTYSGYENRVKTNLEHRI
jgi:hypothetical protein